MTWQDDALSRVAALIQEGEQIPITPQSPYGGGVSVLSAPFAGWRTKVIAALVGLLGLEHTYTTEFQIAAVDSYTYHRDAGVAILKALHSDIELGFLRKISNIISAEIFADFLEMADHLLQQDYKDPAASLCGAVLEDGLRRIATNATILISSNDDLNSLRDKCFQKKVIDKLALKEIDTWSTIRNSADHGKFGEYDARQVKSMIDGVRSFLSKHLSSGW